VTNTIDDRPGTHTTWLNGAGCFSVGRHLNIDDEPVVHIGAVIAGHGHSCSSVTLWFADIDQVRAAASALLEHAAAIERAGAVL
jgi:hypothetical protein